jgi:hypothetical protein
MGPMTQDVTRCILIFKDAKRTGLIPFRHALLLSTTTTAILETVNTSKPEIYVNNILKFISDLTENKLHQYYKNQRLNSEKGHDGFYFDKAQYR